MIHALQEGSAHPLERGDSLTDPPWPEMEPYPLIPHSAGERLHLSILSLERVQNSGMRTGYPHSSRPLNGMDGSPRRCSSNLLDAFVNVPFENGTSWHPMSATDSLPQWKGRIPTHKLGGNPRTAVVQAGEREETGSVQPQPSPLDLLYSSFDKSAD